MKMTDETLEFLTRLKDKVKLVLQRHKEQVTDFVDPYLKRVAEEYLKNQVGINYASFGGVERAERQRILICPEYLHPSVELAGISIIRLIGNLNYVSVSHRDYLGALLGQGIKREKVGDIYPVSDGCVVILSRELADFLMVNPLKVKGVTLKATELQVGEWIPEKPEGKVVAVTLSSLRLDTVVAHGFGLSRTKVVGYIKGGKVKVNWQIIEDLDYKCAENDVISFRGKGRILISEICGETKKGRIKVNLVRYK